MFPSLCIPYQVEFESNIEGKVAAEGPPGVSNITSLVYLNHSDPMVDVTGKLRKAGQYVFVVHYFQPHYPGESLVVRWCEEDSLVSLFTFYFKGALLVTWQIGEVPTPPNYAREQVTAMFQN